MLLAFLAVRSVRGFNNLAALCKNFLSQFIQPTNDRTPFLFRGIGAFNILSMLAELGLT